MLIVAWNINPNRIWFASLADTGTGIAVSLYLTQADAESQANRQAYGESSGYSGAVTLMSDVGATVPVSLYQNPPSWHLQVSGAAQDPAVIYRIKEFVDLDDIEHAIYRNAGLIPVRAQAEIDAHAHVKVAFSAESGSHHPTLRAGDIARMAAQSRGVDTIAQIVSHKIEGTPDSLSDTVTLASFRPLRR